MLDLIYALPSEVAPLPLEPDAPGVKQWRDMNGQLCLYGYTSGDESWLHFPGLASYRFVAHSTEVTVFPQVGASAPWVEDSFWRVVAPLVLQSHGVEGLHASAVRTARGVVAFCGLAETGKSTIAYAMSQRGHMQWSDDVVMLEISAASVMARSLPYAVRLRTPSAKFFGREAKRSAADGKRIRVSKDSWGTQGFEPERLAGVFVMQRLDALPDGASVSVRRLSGSAAFRAVIEHAYCFSFQDGHSKQRMVQQYLELVRRVPVFEIRFATGLDRLPAILDAIEAATEGAHAVP